MKQPPIARGPGPVPFRIVLVVLACAYFGVLLKHPTKLRMYKGDSKGRVAAKGVLDAIAHLSECTGLFPDAAKVGKGPNKWVPGGKEYRFEAWSCERKSWEPIDTRPYFPIQADDKESRLPRILHYYYEEADDKAQREALMYALDDYLYAHHDGELDNVAGPIGGFRLWIVRTEYGEPGDPVERYASDPLAPIPTDRAQIGYNTSRGTRKDGQPGMRKRCKAEGDPMEPEPASTPAPQPDPWSTP